MLASIRREEDEHTVMLRSLGALYSSGYPVDWSRIYPDEVHTSGCRRTHGSDNAAGWRQDQIATIARKMRRLTREREILCSGGISSRLSRAALIIGNSDWTRSRCLFSMIIESKESRPCPRRSMSRWHRRAAQEALGSRSIALADIEFHRALFLPDGARPTLQVIVAPGADGAASFQIYSSSAGTEPSDQVMDSACIGESLCPAGLRFTFMRRRGVDRRHPASLLREGFRTRLLSTAWRKCDPVRTFFPERYSVVGGQ